MFLSSQRCVSPESKLLVFLEMTASDFLYGIPEGTEMREVHYEKYSQTDEYCKSDTRHIPQASCESKCEVLIPSGQEVYTSEYDDDSSIVPEEYPVKSMGILSDRSKT